MCEVCGGGLQGAAVLLTGLKSVCGVEGEIQGAATHWVEECVWCVEGGYRELLCYSLV